MLLRAVFWISVVALLMPHGPDLGLGHKPTTIAELAAAPSAGCAGHEAGCAMALGVLDPFQSVAVRSLAQVKADIEQAQREAAHKPGAD